MLPIIGYLDTSVSRFWVIVDMNDAHLSMLFNILQLINYISRI